MWQTYHSPRTLHDALHLLADYGAEARIVAGGTDLLVELGRREAGAPPLPALVDVTRIAGLDRVWLDDEGWIHIGPCVTHNQAVASRLLRERGRPLAQACWSVGSPQLRNRATIAGNLVTASPANDTITALWALDARLTLQSVQGERTLSFQDFYQGVRRTALQPEEILTDVAFRAMAPNQHGVFVKLGLRRTHAISVVNAAAVLTLAPGACAGERVVTGARLALGSVAPTILRVPAAEKALVGALLDEDRTARAADLAAAAAAPIDDVRAGAEYRRETVRVLVCRALDSLRADTTGTTQQATGFTIEQTAIPDDPAMLWGKTDGHFAFPAEPPDTWEAGHSPICCTVNGRRVEVSGAQGKTLLQMLRQDLGLPGTKNGCSEGECGACTVWMDGIAVLACLVPAPRAHGASITTVEGLSQGEALHPVQQAFVEQGAVQCGYCTPGFVMSGANLLDEIPRPSRDQIATALSGNLCRCTGYYKIIAALESAALAVEKAAAATGRN
jgi:carbon-monoxide dehydrogenase medium subunit